MGENARFQRAANGGSDPSCRIWRFWGPPIFSPEVPKYLFLKGFGTPGRNIGAPKNAKFNHDGSDPTLRPSDV